MIYGSCFSDFFSEVSFFFVLIASIRMRHVLNIGVDSHDTVNVKRFCRMNAKFTGSGIKHFSTLMCYFKVL